MNLGNFIVCTMGDFFFQPWHFFCLFEPWLLFCLLDHGKIILCRNKFIFDMVIFLWNMTITTKIWMVHFYLCVLHDGTTLFVCSCIYYTYLTNLINILPPCDGNLHFLCISSSTQVVFLHTCHDPHNFLAMASLHLFSPWQLYSMHHGRYILFQPWQSYCLDIVFL